MPNYENCTGFQRIKIDRQLTAPAKKYTDAHFVADVNAAIAALQEKPLGQEFLAALEAKLAKKNKEVLIRLNTPKQNQCAGDQDQFVLLRKQWSGGGDKAAAKELRITLGLAETGEIDGSQDEDREKLLGAANALFLNPIPTWDPRTIEENPLKKKSAEEYLPLLLKWINATDVADDKCKNVLLAWFATRDRARKDKKVQGLEVGDRLLRKGAGSGSTIYWLPNNEGPPNYRRPPCIGLAHELCHAYYSASGEQIGSEGGTEGGAMLYELMTTGLGPYFSPYSPRSPQGWKYCENSFRIAFQVPLREKYG